MEGRALLSWMWVAFAACLIVVSSASASGSMGCFDDDTFRRPHRVIPEEPVFKPVEFHPARFSLYFLLTRRLGSGGLLDVAAQAQALAALGRTHLWVSPLQEQTTEFFNGTHNDHGYWISTFNGVDERLGGPRALSETLRTLREQNLDLVLDVVMGHVGYTDRVRMNYRKQDGQWVDKWIYTTDPQYFRQDTRELPYEALERVTTRQEFDAVRKVFHERRLAELPGFNYDNPEILEWMISAYQWFADLGIRNFRIDASKHFPLEAQARFIDAMTKYCQQKLGVTPTFILEYLVSNDLVLKFVYDIIEQETESGAHVVYLDFPRAHTFRKLGTDLTFGFDDLRDFVERRDSHGWGMPVRRLVPVLQDHDLLTPILPHHPFNETVMMLATEFTSGVPTMFYHGMETPGKRDGLRGHIEGVDGDGPLGLFARHIAQGMLPFRESPSFQKTYWHHASHDALVAEKRMRMPDGTQRGLFLVVQRDAVEVRVKLENRPWDHSMRTVRYHAGEGRIELVGDVGSESGYAIDLAGPSYSLFEVEYSKAEGP